jgi:hypothetical protein
MPEHANGFCVACGRRLADKRLHVQGLFGTTKHECPSAKQSAATRLEEPIVRNPPLSTRLRDGFESLADDEYPDREGNEDA